MELRVVIGFICILIVCFLLFVLYIYSNKGYKGTLVYFKVKEGTMSRYEKVKLLLFIIFGVLFLSLTYFNGLSGRYVMHPNKGVMIDSRTGDIFALDDRRKLN